MATGSDFETQFMAVTTTYIATIAGKPHDVDFG